MSYNYVLLKYFIWKFLRNAFIWSNAHSCTLLSHIHYQSKSSTYGLTNVWRIPQRPVMCDWTIEKNIVKFFRELVNRSVKGQTYSYFFLNIGKVVLIFSQGGLHTPISTLILNAGRDDLFPGSPVRRYKISKDSDIKTSKHCWSSQ